MRLPHVFDAADDPVAYVLHAKHKPVAVPFYAVNKPDAEKMGTGALCP